MEHPLSIYNTLTRKKEPFKPLHEPHVGMYVVLRFMVTLIWDTHVRRSRSTCYSVISLI